MFKPFFRHRISVALLTTLLVLTFALSACGGDTTSTAATTGGSSTGGSTQTVTITEQTGGNDIYAFAPTTLSVKAGDSVKWVNNSDENHKLMISPTGPTSATADRSGSNDNTATIAFSTAGTYTITSQLIDRLKDGKHTPDPADSKATMTITVN
jgi:plastocyanin